MEYEHLLIFGGLCVVTWCLVIYFWPRMLLSVYKRGLLVKGFGEAPSRSIRSIRSPKSSLQSPSLRKPP